MFETTTPRMAIFNSRTQWIDDHPRTGQFESKFCSSTALPSGPTLDEEISSVSWKQMFPSFFCGYISGAMLFKFIQ